MAVLQNDPAAVLYCLTDSELRLLALAFSKTHGVGCALLLVPQLLDLLHRVVAWCKNE